MKTHIFSPCCKRKSLPIADYLNYDFGKRLEFNEWWARIDEWMHPTSELGQPTKTARDLYKGELWSIFKGIAATPNTQGWVVSAGCGLTQIDERLPPYAITFANQNFKVNTIRDTAEWWDNLCAASGRSITSVHNEQDLFIFALGSAYLQAIRNDLQHLKGKPNVWIVTSDSAVSREFEDNRVKTSVKWRYATGGSDVSINMAAMAAIVDAGCRTIEEARALVAGVEARADPDRKKPVRARLTDDEVIARCRAPENKGKSHSTMLTEFRANGIAIQDSRIHRLWHIAHNITDRHLLKSHD